MSGSYSRTKSAAACSSPARMRRMNSVNVADSTPEFLDVTALYRSGHRKAISGACDLPRPCDRAADAQRGLAAAIPIGITQASGLIRRTDHDAQVLASFPRSTSSWRESPPQASAPAFATATGGTRRPRLTDDHVIPRLRRCLPHRGIGHD